MIENGPPREILDLVIGKHDDVPDGWKTAMEWAKEWNRCDSTARDYIIAAVKGGLMEERQFHILIGGRKSYPVMHYKLLKKKQ
jgi:hypothetical protein